MKKILLASILITINSCYLFKSGLNFEIYNNSIKYDENAMYFKHKNNITNIFLLYHLKYVFSSNIQESDIKIPSIEQQQNIINQIKHAQFNIKQTFFMYIV